MQKSVLPPPRMRTLTPGYGYAYNPERVRLHRTGTLAQERLLIPKPYPNRRNAYTERLHGTLTPERLQRRICFVCKHPVHTDTQSAYACVPRDASVPCNRSKFPNGYAWLLAFGKRTRSVFRTLPNASPNAYTERLRTLTPSHAYAF